MTSLGPFARKDFNCRPGLIDAAVGLAPFEFEVAAAEVVEDAALGAAGEDASDADGAGAGAAGERFAAAAFPRALADFGWRNDLDELDVHAGREHGVVFDLRAEAEHQFVGGPLDVRNAVRVAHRDASDLQRAAIDGKR